MGLLADLLEQCRTAGSLCNRGRADGYKASACHHHPSYQSMQASILSKTLVLTGSKRQGVGSTADGARFGSVHGIVEGEGSAGTVQSSQAQAGPGMPGTSLEEADTFACHGDEHNNGPWAPQAFLSQNSALQSYCAQRKPFKGCWDAHNFDSAPG